MSIIQTHDITLYGGYGSAIVLRPLNDGHLPLLYKWCADPEVLYWTEGGTADTNLSYGPETVHEIYGGVSKNALCFLVEVSGAPVGECWLQKMNIPAVIDMYPESPDVRRIDMAIGEKAYWNKGVGSEFIGKMVDLAFCGEHADVLHCFCEDYNIRSRRMWEKHGFTKILEEPLTPQPQKGKFQYHYRLTRGEFIERRRRRAPGAAGRFAMPIAGIQPTQLYVSEGRMRLIREWFNPDDAGSFDPIPIKKLDGRIIMLDGHSRAVAAILAGWERIPAYWDTDDYDMNAYAACVNWCRNEGVGNPADLAARIVPYKDFERLWLKRCMEMEIT